MSKTYCFLFSIFLAWVSSGLSQPVNLVYDKSSPQSTYAASMLQKALMPGGYTLNNTKADLVITLSINAQQLRPEAYSIRADKKTFTITGGDERGMIYGSLSLAE